MGSVFVNLPNHESLSVTSQTNSFWYFHGHLQTCGNSKKMCIVWHTQSQLRLNKETLLFCSSSHTVNKCLFCGLFNASFLCILLVILLFQLASNWSSAKCYPVWSPFGRKHVLDKHCSGMSYSVVGCEFKVNEKIINIQQDV